MTFLNDLKKLAQIAGLLLAGLWTLDPEKVDEFSARIRELGQ